MFDDTSLQNNTTTFYTNPMRVISATLLLGLGALIVFILVLFLWMMLLGYAPSELPNITSDVNALSNVGYEAQTILLLFAHMVPLAIAGAYWLALLRLRRRRALRVWLEGIGFSLLYLVGTGIFAGVESYYFVWTNYYLPPALDHPWWFFTLFGEVPQMLPYVLILALSSATIALGIALLFARWREVRLACLPSRGGRDFLFVFGIVSIVTFLAELAYAFIPDRYFEVYFAPAVIIGVIVSCRTYHVLHRAWQIACVRGEVVRSWLQEKMGEENL